MHYTTPFNSTHPRRYPFSAIILKGGEKRYYRGGSYNYEGCHFRVGSHLSKKHKKDTPKDAT